MDQAVDEALLHTPANLLPEVPPPNLRAQVGKSEALLDVACDLFIPAAVENAVTEKNFLRCRARQIVPGANLAVTEKAAAQLGKRGITVLPDYVAGCGGSLFDTGFRFVVIQPNPVVKFTRQSANGLFVPGIGKSQPA